MVSGKRIAILIVPLALLLGLLLPLKSGFTDDGFIHIQYAENLINRGEYSFNPGEVSFGTTSPLWVLAQAAIGLVIGGGEKLIHTSRVLSWLSGFLAVILVWVCARRAGVGLFASYLAATAFAAHAWFVRWTALSMETASAVAALAAVGIAAVGAFRDHRAAWGLGFFMAVAALIRPEAYLLVPVYIVAFSLQPRPWDRSLAARTLGMFALLIVPWLGFARWHIGSFLPNTAGAKSGGLILSPAVFVGKLEPVAQIMGSAEGLHILCIAAALVLLRSKSRLLSRPLRFHLLWVIALPVAYVVFDIQILSRYLLLLSPFVAVLGFAALEELCGRLPQRARRAALVLATAVVVAVNVVFYFIVIVPPSREFSYDLSHNMKRVAVYIEKNSPQQAVVAAADIGYLAFYSNRRVLDLGGLVEPETGTLREAHTYEEIVEKGMYLNLERYPRVDFFIDRDKERNRFAGAVIEGHRFERVLEEKVRNLGIRKPGPFYYTLYRLHRLPPGGTK